MMARKKAKVADRGVTPLHTAALGGCSAELDAVLRKKHISAPEHFHREVVRLLKQGADPNARDWDGRTPLHYAVMGGKIKSVKILLAHGANPKIECRCSKMNPLHEALSESEMRDMWKIAQTLLKARAPLKPRFDGAKTAMFLACGNGALRGFLFMLKRGVSPNIRDKGGRTLIHACAFEDQSVHVRILEQLLRGGVDWRIEDDKKRTALSYVEEHIAKTTFPDCARIWRRQKKLLLRAPKMTTHRNFLRKFNRGEEDITDYFTKWTMVYPKPKKEGAE